MNGRFFYGTYTGVRFSTKEGAMQCTCCHLQDEELFYALNLATGHHEPLCASCLLNAPPGKYAASAPDPVAA